MMKLPEGTVIMHGAQPYDPQKAHEYYLRVRQLKGRKAGSAVIPAGNRRAAVPDPRQQKQQQRVKVAAQIKALTETLHKLKSELRKRTAKAERAAKAADKPATAAEKAQKSRDSKKYRDAHQQELKTKAKRSADGSSGSKSGGGDKKNSVAGLKRSIAKVENQLAAAKVRQRALN